MNKSQLQCINACIMQFPRQCILQMTDGIHMKCKQRMMVRCGLVICGTRSQIKCSKCLRIQLSRMADGINCQKGAWRNLCFLKTRLIQVFLSIAEPCIAICLSALEERLWRQQIGEQDSRCGIMRRLPPENARGASWWSYLPKTKRLHVFCQEICLDWNDSFWCEHRWRIQECVGIRILGSLVLISSMRLKNGEFKGLMKLPPPPKKTAYVFMKKKSFFAKHFWKCFLWKWGSHLGSSACNRTLKMSCPQKIGPGTWRRFTLSLDRR